MNARLYDAKLHRFLAPDNYIQQPYNTQNYNRYGYVLNNPLSYVDTSGETAIGAILVGIAVGVFTNGVANSIHGQPFFKDALFARVFGGISGGFSFGIGAIATKLTGLGLKSVSIFAIQTVAHASLGGVMTSMNGGQLVHGFISGMAGSLMASVAGNALKNIKNAYMQAGGMILSGAVAGGVASEISGGSFWDGFRNGLISAGLNHAMHYVYQSIDGLIKEYENNVK